MRLGHGRVEATNRNVTLACGAPAICLTYGEVIRERTERSLTDEVAKQHKLPKREHRSEQKPINAEAKVLAALKRQERKEIKLAAAAARKREQEENKADRKRCREALDARKAAKMARTGGGGVALGQRAVAAAALLDLQGPHQL